MLSLAVVAYMCVYVGDMLCEFMRHVVLHIGVVGG